MNYIPPAAWPHIPDLIRALVLTCVGFSGYSSVDMTVQSKRIKCVDQNVEQVSWVRHLTLTIKHLQFGIKIIDFSILCNSIL